jgi:phenylacetic acid degradation operon negative regulatory protein
VTAGRRTAAERAELRAALAGGRLVEWREGVWTRPDNLDRPALRAHLADQVAWVAGRPEVEPTHLWDLDGWIATADALVERLEATRGALDERDTDALAPGFVLSAAVLRHLAADPLLPAALVPAGWPGDRLRRVYDGWDRAYRDVLAGWHRAHP